MTGQFYFPGIRSNDSLKNAKTTKVFLADLSEVDPNSENIFPVNEEDVDNLAESIASEGILHDVVAYRRDDRYVLLSGHHRLAACRKLAAEGRNYMYHGMDITGKLPITVTDDPVNNNRILLQIVEGNHQRVLSSDEKKLVIRKVLIALQNLNRQGKYEWPVGVRTAKVLSTFTGYKEHFIKDYLAEAGLSKTSDISEDDDCGAKRPVKKAELSSGEKQLKSFRSALTRMSRQKEVFDWTLLDQLNEEELFEIRGQMADVVRMLDEKLNDDAEDEDNHGMSEREERDWFNEMKETDDGK